MRFRPLVLVCLVAIVVSLVPVSVIQAAPSTARPAVVLLSASDLLSSETTPPVAGAAKAALPLQALRVGFTESKLFTVVCRSWQADSDLDSTQGSWYLGEKSQPLADAARSIPLIGHACAFTEDPSLENAAVLALDIPVVVLYAKVAYDGVVAVNGIAMTVGALAPVAAATGPVGVANAIQIVRTQAQGYIAVIEKDLQTARAQKSRTVELQAYIKQNHDWTVVLNEDWVSSALPKIVSAALADPATRQAVGNAIVAAGDAAGEAVGQGAAAAGESAVVAGSAIGESASGAKVAAGVAGQAIGQGAVGAAGAALEAAASVAAKAGEFYQQNCLKLPAALQFGCAAAGN